MNKFKDKKILITGASSGIGKSLAKALLSNGAHVIGIGKRTKQEIETMNYYPIDLSSLECVDKIVNLIEEPLDFFFCNAGMAYNKRFDETSYSQILEQLNINLNVPLVLTKKLLEQGKLNLDAHIIFTSSLCGLYPMGNLSIYSATKFGIEGFAGALRKEQVTRVITVVRPGVVRTEFFGKAGMDDFKTFLDNNRYMSHSPDLVSKKILKYIDKEIITIGSDQLFIKLEKFIPNQLKDKFLNFTNYFNQLLNKI